jgi:hypothetical protein
MERPAGPRVLTGQRGAHGVEPHIDARGPAASPGPVELRWLETTTQGEPDLADLYERRFTPEFRPAFDAWTAQGDPLHDPDAVASPLLMPEYAPAAMARANELESEAEEHFNEGKEATENADKYIFGTVFFAAVLFFAGMSLRFEWPALRLAVLGLGALFLAYGVVQIASLPTR